jgi:Predicted Zn-dependent protease (DUF2268)
MKNSLFIFFFFTLNLMAQNATKLDFNKPYNDQIISKAKEGKYPVNLEKGNLYDVAVFQNGIDVLVEILDKDNKKLAEKDSPIGSWGFEKFEFTPTQTALYFINIKRLDEKGNPDSGMVNIKVKQLTKADLVVREKIKKELEPENKKTVQTADIDHFWAAWDNLKACKTYDDSIQSFEKLYIDKATDGFLDFIKVRQWNAEEYVNMARKHPKFYNSVRKNTFEVKKAEPLIEEVFQKFKAIYPNFKPFKVCFAIGAVRTGGTVSENFVLIGTEITTSTNKVDLSEIKNEAFRKILEGEEDIVQKIKNMIAHECVHTQQVAAIDTNAVTCHLLYRCMQEGFCDFIGELVTGSQINKVNQDYGNAHEKELWYAFKEELCGNKTGGWLYNFSSVKDKPADLGYYMGYKIAQSYYAKAVDKKQAIIDIIEMKNPLQFLEKSGYDKKF